MRLLDRESIRFDLDALGFAGPGRAHFEAALQRPHGIILVTGPTGSGKTTTLYTALSRLNSPERKIITVEDPVEYQLDGINQIQVKPSIGLTFAGALRSIVRQDPDIIMIGEMRDLETAKIAVQSALTGHLVLSTLHTNDAAGSVSRLLDMGVEDFLLGSTVIGILAQRLVRTLCRHCAEPWQVPEDRVEALGLRRLQPHGPVTLFRAVGCAQCNDIGYRGRTTILEMLPMTEALRAAIMRHATTGELERIARDEGMQTMYEHGLSKALAGVTSLEEVTRVIQDA
jgi:general secretion pathway protein E